MPVLGKIVVAVAIFGHFLNSMQTFKHFSQISGKFEQITTNIGKVGTGVRGSGGDPAGIRVAGIRVVSFEDARMRCCCGAPASTEARFATGPRRRWAEQLEPPCVHVARFPDCSNLQSP